MRRDCRNPECKIGIKKMGTRLLLYLKFKRAPYGFDRKAFGLDFVK
jgi:hypothetical protein